MVVRSWSELDFDNVCSNAKVFGFDLDNTLASSKQPMKPAMIERFCALLDHTVVALISGGGMAVVTSQVLDVLTPNARRGNLHVMPTSGSRYYRWDGTQWALVYAHDLSEATVAAVSESLERHARELGLWEQQVWGPRIENRGSQIIFSALGQFAPVAAKQAWDRDNTKKQALVEAVKADLPHMRVRAGGYTSVDVSECGIDKAYAISAGREVRVIVRPESIDDLSAIKLARDIATKIESTMQYPGTIKVNVIRETRAIECAK